MIISLNNSLNGLGSATLLGSTSSTTSTNEVTVADISQYKYLYLTIEQTSSIISEIIIPVNLFTSLPKKFTAFYNLGIDYRAYAQYVNATKVNMYVLGVCTAYLYGVK